MKITSVSFKAMKLIEHFECSGDVNNPKWLNAYQDTGGIWTIGIGTTRYLGAAKVKKGDKISVEDAYKYLQFDLKQAMLDVDALTTDGITQGQFDALVSFVYNVGSGQQGYKGSTLRRVINDNPNNYAEIVKQFQRWKFDDGKEQPGLLRRRKAEAYLYCHNEIKFYFSNNEKIEP